MLFYDAAACSPSLSAPQGTVLHKMYLSLRCYSNASLQAAITLNRLHHSLLLCCCCAQAKLLSDMFSRAALSSPGASEGSEAEALEIKTVDGFQGREKEVRLLRTSAREVWHHTERQDSKRCILRIQNCCAVLAGAAGWCWCCCFAQGRSALHCWFLFCRTPPYCTLV